MIGAGPVTCLGSLLFDDDLVLCHRPDMHPRPAALTFPPHNFY